MNKPYSEVAGVVGFYSFFTTVPRGKHLVRVCLGTACYVRGGKEVLAALKTALDVEVGETTSDRVFSLDVGRCFGACGLAPVIMIDDDVHQRVKPARVGKILDSIDKTNVAGGNGNGERHTERTHEYTHRQRRTTHGASRRRSGRRRTARAIRPQADPAVHGRQLHRLGGPARSRPPCSANWPSAA